MPKLTKKQREDNRNRASAAETGLEAWLTAKGSNGAGDAEENLVDLLTDLRHMAVAQKIDFDGAAESSAMHYAAEAAGED